MRLTFFGAAGEVTGSKHLVEIGRHRILLDCGLFQGRRREALAKNSRLSFDPKSITAVVISHAHLDHVGQLPLLVKHGFTGPIYSTSATRDLTELILLDAAHIQEQDAAFAAKHQLPNTIIPEPLYRQEDIEPVMKLFQVVPWQRDVQDWQAVASGLQLKMYDAGHILGSAVVVLSDGTETVVYTGDLGRPARPLLHDPEYVIDPAQALIMESTYGIREHHTLQETEDSLAAVINAAVTGGGKIVVPSFSLGRTQELIYLIHQLTDQQKIPRIPVVVDSPLASRITDVFARHQQEYNTAAGTDFSRPHEDPLVFRNLVFTHSVEESKALNTHPGPMIIISSSGMLSGGRVMHHLRNNLSDAKNTVLFTGYQAEHTPGRRLIKGATQLQIHGEMVPVRAKIVALNDLSAHADANELIAYAEHISGLKNIFLVHGEDDRRLGLQQLMASRHPDWRVTLPTVGEAYTVTN